MTKYWRVVENTPVENNARAAVVTVGQACVRGDGLLSMTAEDGGVHLRLGRLWLRQPCRGRGHIRNPSPAQWTPFTDESLFDLPKPETRH
jgi:hypothetical protein